MFGPRNANESLSRRPSASGPKSTMRTGYLLTWTVYGPEDGEPVTINARFSGPIARDLCGNRIEELLRMGIEPKLTFINGEYA